MTWISVEDRLPELHTPVLILVFYTDYDGEEYKTIGIGELIKKRKKFVWFEVINWNCPDFETTLEGDWIKIKFWMPLPDKPL